MYSLIVINGVAYDIVSSSETSVCPRCVFNILNLPCPRLAGGEVLVCSWLDNEDDGMHYFIEHCFLEREV